MATVTMKICGYGGGKYLLDDGNGNIVERTPAEINLAPPPREFYSGPEQFLQGNQPEQEDTNPLREFGAGVGAGIEQLKGMGYSGVGMIGHAIGAEGLEEWGARNAAETEEAIKRDYPAAVGSFRDIKDAGDIVNYLGYGLGTLTPMALTSVFSGGVGAAVGVGGVKALLKTALTETAKKAAQRGAMAGTALSSVGMETTSIGQMQKQQTGDYDLPRALAGGTVAGMLDVVPEWYLIKKLPAFGGEIYGSVVRRITEGGLKQAMMEGPTEAAQTIIENESVPGTKVRNQDYWDQVIDSAIIGAFGGGAIGGGVSGLFGNRNAPDRGEPQVGPQGGPIDLTKPGRNLQATDFGFWSGNRPEGEGPTGPSFTPMGGINPYAQAQEAQPSVIDMQPFFSGRRFDTSGRGMSALDMPRVLGFQITPPEGFLPDIGPAPQEPMGPATLGPTPLGPPPTGPYTPGGPGPFFGGVHPSMQNAIGGSPTWFGPRLDLTGRMLTGENQSTGMRTPLQRGPVPAQNTPVSPIANAGEAFAGPNIPAPIQGATTAALGPSVTQESVPNGVQGNPPTGNLTYKPIPMTKGFVPQGIDRVIYELSDDVASLTNGKPLSSSTAEAFDSVAEWLDEIFPNKGDMVAYAKTLAPEWMLNEPEALNENSARRIVYNRINEFIKGKANKPIEVQAGPAQAAGPNYEAEAKSLGIIYNGAMEIPGRAPIHQFTDPTNANASFSLKAGESLPEKLAAERQKKQKPVAVESVQKTGKRRKPIKTGAEKKAAKKEKTEDEAWAPIVEKATEEGLMSADEFDALVDNSFAEKKAEPVVNANKRTGRRKIKTAKEHAAEGVKEGFAALGELFGFKDTSTLRSGPAFDDETYKKAKPHFEKAFSEFTAAGKDMKEFVQYCLNTFSDAIKPYLKKFYRDKVEAKEPLGDFSAPAPQAKAEQRKAPVKQAERVATVQVDESLAKDFDISDMSVDEMKRKLLREGEEIASIKARLTNDKLHKDFAKQHGYTKETATLILNGMHDRSQARATKLAKAILAKEKPAFQETTEEQKVVTVEQRKDALDSVKTQLNIAIHSADSNKRKAARAHLSGLIAKLAETQFDVSKLNTLYERYKAADWKAGEKKSVATARRTRLIEKMLDEVSDMYPNDERTIEQKTSSGETVHPAIKKSMTNEEWMARFAEPDIGINTENMTDKTQIRAVIDTLDTLDGVTTPLSPRSPAGLAQIYRLAYKALWAEGVEPDKIKMKPGKAVSKKFIEGWNAFKQEKQATSAENEAETVIEPVESWDFEDKSKPEKGSGPKVEMGPAEVTVVTKHAIMPETVSSIIGNTDWVQPKNVTSEEMTIIEAMLDRGFIKSRLNEKTKKPEYRNNMTMAERDNFANWFSTKFSHVEERLIRSEAAKTSGIDEELKGKTKEQAIEYLTKQIFDAQREAMNASDWQAEKSAQTRERIAQLRLDDLTETTKSKKQTVSLPRPKLLTQKEREAIAAAVRKEEEKSGKEQPIENYKKAWEYILKNRKALSEAMRKKVQLYINGSDAPAYQTAFANMLKQFNQKVDPYRFRKIADIFNGLIKSGEYAPLMKFKTGAEREVTKAKDFELGDIEIGQDAVDTADAVETKIDDMDFSEGNVSDDEAASVAQEFSKGESPVLQVITKQDILDIKEEAKPLIPGIAKTLKVIEIERDGKKAWQVTSQGHAVGELIYRERKDAISNLMKHANELAIDRVLAMREIDYINPVDIADFNGAINDKYIGKALSVDEINQYLADKNKEMPDIFPQVFVREDVDGIDDEAIAKAVDERFDSEQRNKLSALIQKSTGKIYLFAKNIHGFEHLAQLFLHEAVSHYGMRQLFKGKYDQFLDTVWDSFKDDKRMKEIVKKYRFKTEMLERDKHREWADEFIADKAEKGINDISIITYLKDMVGEFFRRMFKYDTIVTEQDITRLLRLSKAHMRYGIEAWVNGLSGPTRVSASIASTINPSNISNAVNMKFLSPESIKDYVSGYAAWGRKLLPWNQSDFGFWANLAVSPEWWQHPVMKKLFEIAMNRSELFHTYMQKLINITDENGNETGENILDLMKQLRGVVSDPDERLGQLVDRIKGYRSKFDVKRARRIAYITDKLVNEMSDKNVKWPDIRDKAVKMYPPEVIEIVDALRQRYDAALDMYIEKLRTFINETEETAKEEGIEAKMPTMVSYDDKGKVVPITLKQAMTIFGSLRGSYAPRIRQGKYVFKATRPLAAEQDSFAANKVENELARYQHDNYAKLVTLKKKMEREGWKCTEITEEDKLEEIVQNSLRYEDIQQLMDKTFSKLQKDLPEDQKELAITQHVELIMAIRNEMMSRGFRSSLQARQRDVVIQGYEKDTLKQAAIYFANAAAGFAKIDTANAMLEAITPQWKTVTEEVNGKKVKNRIRVEGVGLDATKDKRAYALAKKYISHQLRHSDDYDRVIARAKQLVSIKYLGFSFRAPIVNTTALLITAPAAIHSVLNSSKDGTDIGFTEIMKALKSGVADYTKYMSQASKKKRRIISDIDVKTIKGWDRTFVDEEVRRGYDNQQYTTEAMGGIKGTNVGNGFDNLVTVSMSLFGMSEQMIRGATLLAAFRLAAKKTGLDKMEWSKNPSAEAKALFEQCCTEAKLATREAHAVYNRPSDPVWVMGDQLFAKVGQMFYLYMKFPHNFVQLLWDTGIRKKQYKEAMWLMAMPAILSGPVAFPFYSLISWFVGALMSGLGDDDRDPEKLVWDKMEDYMGKTVANALRGGALGAAGIDVTSSLATGMELPRKPLDFLGVLGGFTEDMIEFERQLSVGNLERAFTKLMPSIGANTARTFIESKGGVVSGTARPLYDEEGKPVYPTKMEHIMRLVTGTGSPRIGLIQRDTYLGKKQQEKMKNRRDKIYERLRVIHELKRPPETMRNLLIDVQEYNKRANAMGGKRAGIPLITPEQLAEQRKQLVSVNEQAKKLHYHQ